MADATTTVQESQTLVGGWLTRLGETLGLIQAEPEQPAPAAPAAPADAPPPGQTEPAAVVEINYQYNNGALVLPPADGTGMTQHQMQALGGGIGGMAMFGSMFTDVPEFARDGLGYSPGQIDMINDLARRYDGIEVTDLQGTLVALAADDALRDDVMGALMENDQELAHYAVQAFEQDPTLLAQFEDLVRNDPDKVREMLPQMRENPDRFAELVRDQARDPETALAANNAAAATADSTQDGLMAMMGGIFSGDITFSEILGPQMGGMLDGVFGPLLEMFKGLLDSARGFVSQNLPEDSPIYDLFEGVGLTKDTVHDVTATPDNEPVPGQPAPGTDPTLQDPAIAGPR